MDEVSLINDSLHYLDYLEQVRDSPASVKYQIQTLKVELKFLSLFFKCIQLKNEIEDEALKDRVNKIKAVVEDLVQVISSRYDEAKVDGGKAAMDLDGSLTYVLQKIESIKPEVDQCYRPISQLGNRLGFYHAHDWEQLIECVLENLKDLIQSSQVTSIFEVKRRIDALERKLLYLRKSFQFGNKLEVSMWFLHEEIGYATVTAASFFFHCWISEMNENKELPDLSLALINKPDREKTALYQMLFDIYIFRYNSEETLITLYLDFLLQNLAEVLSSNGSMEIPIKDQLECLREEMKLLRSLQDTDHGISYEQQMGVHLNKAARLIEDLYVGNINEEKMMMINNDILPQVLGRLKLINIFCAMELENRDEASLVAPIKDKFETLDKDIRLLKAFYIGTQKGDNIDKEVMDIHSNMDAVVLEAAPIFYSLYVNETKQDMAEEMISLLPDLLEKINLIKKDIWRIYLRFTSSYFPNTGGQRDTSSYLKQLNQLLTKRADIVSQFAEPHMIKASKFHIKYIKNKFELMISFLAKYEEQCIDLAELIALEKRITDMAFEAQCVTDPIFIRGKPDWIYILKFSALVEEVNLINREMESINEKVSGEMLSSQDNTSGEVIVGFEDAALNIMKQLTEGPGKLSIISIIGMGGLGKTTLARKLYNNPLGVEYFDVRAWCCVSQEYQPEQILLDILGQVTEEINVKSVQGLDEQLYKCLKGRRYLIVMDDIWDIKAWTSLSRCFHDDSNGSRIIFTTRDEKVAFKVQSRNSIPNHLRYFNEDESCELLQKRLFPGGRCPREEVENVKQIAKSCKGLPLAVVLMAGVLVTKKREEWKKVAESLSRHNDKDLKNLCNEVLELSYKNLPDFLRPCFLYLGGFPEDKDIPAKKLMWLWVAEKFVKKSELKSSEDIAKDYLMDLISRSLVTVSERGSSGGVKLCRIHDLLLEFSLAKAKEQKFLLLLDGKGEPFAPPNVEFDQQVDSYDANSVFFEQYRMCIYSMPNDFDNWRSSADVCSLLHFAPPIHLNILSSYDASFICSIFKFLNVLDLGRLLLKDLNCVTELLVQLRLLAVRIKSNSIPTSIANLKNLETLIVKGMRGEVAIPSVIWSMVSLRHLHIDNRASLVWDERDANDSILDKLETLSTPSLPCGENSRDVIRLLFNLRKLKCLFMDVDSRNNFPELDSLIQLESLKVSFYGRKVSTGNFSFPLILKKLTLSKFQLPWSDIATIATLPNLEVLKLLFRAFDGKEWETIDDEFPKLKYLKLESLEIEQWNVLSEDHFPRLEKLVVHRCKKLEEIPSCFADMNTLQTIEVKWCNISAANSAQEIFNEQQEMGNESFVVSIYPNLSNQGLESSS